MFARSMADRTIVTILDAILILGKLLVPGGKCFYPEAKAFWY